MSLRAQNEVVVRFDDKEYFSGDKVEGNIEIFVSGAPLKVSNVKWHLNVTEHMMAPESDLKRAQKLRKKNAKRGKPAQVQFNGSPQLRSGGKLFREGSRRSGAQGSNLLRDEEEILEVGEHKFPFTFDLPEYLPPSFRYGSRGLLEYEIWAEVLQPKGKPLKACRALRVGGSIYDQDFVKLNSQPASGVATRDITFPGLGEGRVDLMTMVSSSVFVAGDTIAATVVVGNHSSKSIEKVKAQLKMHVHYVGDSHKRHVVQKWESTTSISAYEGTQGYEVRMTMPHELPGTIVTRKTSDGVKIGTLINVSYYLSVRVKLGVRDLKVKVPLTVLRPDPKLVSCFTPLSPSASSSGITSALVSSSPSVGRAQA